MMKATPGQQTLVCWKDNGGDGSNVGVRILVVQDSIVVDRTTNNRSMTCDRSIMKIHATSMYNRYNKT